MTTPKIIYLKNDLLQGSRDLVFTVDHLICAGYAGRNRQAVQAHIDETTPLGIPAPSRIPIFLNLSPYLMTMDHEISVVGDQSSGEIEFVLLKQGEEVWVTVGSDHTDREQEGRSIPASKQMCAKCLAPTCWAFSDVRGHWDQLILRCRIKKGGVESLYQEGRVDMILSPGDLLDTLPKEIVTPKGGLALFSGTVPTKAGLIFADSYALELEDPVLKRKIRHDYQVKILPQCL
jgi:hypothetical protein